MSPGLSPGAPLRGSEYATYERAQTQPVDVFGKAVPALVTIAVAQNEPRDWYYTDSDTPTGAVDQPATCSLKLTVEVDNVGFDGFDRIRSELDTLEVTVRAHSRGGRMSTSEDPGDAAPLGGGGLAPCQ